jgi:hypothetical protein
MRNHLEEKEILNEKVLEGIDKLLALSKEIVFGGSIALNAVGVIDRSIKDIDLMTSKHKSLNYYNLMQLVCPTEDVKEISETVTDVNGEMVIRVGAKIGDINICIFKIDKVNFSEFKFSGRTIKIQNINDAILAKRCYAQKNVSSAGKHLNDVKQFEQVIDDLLPF